MLNDSRIEGVEYLILRHEALDWLDVKSFDVLSFRYLSLGPLDPNSPD